MKMRLLMATQILCSVGIIMMIILGRAGVVSKMIVNRVDLILLVGLLVVSALRSFPERKKWIAGYIGCSVIAIVFLIISYL